MKRAIILLIVSMAITSMADVVLYKQADGSIKRTWEDAPIVGTTVGVPGNRVRNIDWTKLAVIAADVPEGAINTNQCTNIRDAYVAQAEEEAPKIYETDQALLLRAVVIELKKANPALNLPTPAAIKEKFKELKIAQ